MPSARFGPLVIGFDESVLEPRPWTIEQAAWAIDLAAEVPHGAVLELCRRHRSELSRSATQASPWWPRVMGVAAARSPSWCRWGLRSLSSVRPSC